MSAHFIDMINYVLYNHGSEKKSKKMCTMILHIATLHYKATLSSYTDKIVLGFWDMSQVDNFSPHITSSANVFADLKKNYT